jgi:hypothetical protein
MATPLTTRTIVRGKRWGTFRLVPWLAICPGLMALAMATGRSDWPWPMPPPPPGASVLVPPDHLGLAARLFGAGLMVATILAHGAVITSVGLILAVWIRRPSRAIALNVTVFVLLAIAWPFLAVITSGGRGPGEQGPATLSPIFLAGTLADALSIRHDQFRGALAWGAFWDILVALVAIGLLEQTVRTFDRRLGRMPERGDLNGPAPVPKKGVTDSLDLA